MNDLVAIRQRQASLGYLHVCLRVGVVCGGCGHGPSLTVDLESKFRQLEFLVQQRHFLCVIRFDAVTNVPTFMASAQPNITLDCPDAGHEAFGQTVEVLLRNVIFTETVQETRILSLTSFDDSSDTAMLADRLVRVHKDSVSHAVDVLRREQAAGIAQELLAVIGEFIALIPVATGDAVFAASFQTDAVEYGLHAVLLPQTV